MSWLWRARRAFETMDTSHRLRRALLAGVRASSHTHWIVNGELVCVWRKVKKNRTDARTALVTHRWYGPASVVGKEKNNAFVSYRGRVTKVAPECLRKASVAEQMSWDITTKVKALFEKALDGKDLSWEDFILTNPVDLLIQRCLAWRQNRLLLKGRPVFDDNDGSPVSEAPIDEDEDPNEGERQ